MDPENLEPKKRYIGYDVRGLPFILAYHTEHLCWAAVGFEPWPNDPNKIQPLIVLCQQEQANFIVRAEELP